MDLIEWGTLEYLSVLGGININVTNLHGNVYLRVKVNLASNGHGIVDSKSKCPCSVGGFKVLSVIHFWPFT